MLPTLRDVRCATSMCGIPQRDCILPCETSYETPHTFFRAGAEVSRSSLAVVVCLAALAAMPALAGEAARPDKVSFYFAAHEDDWQLFMNPSAFQDVIKGATRTVFVHLTAGDAGLGA